jgi:glutamyl-tRNA reductase
MNDVWVINVDDLEEIYKLAVKNGKKAGEGIEEELKEYAKMKGIKPIGATELTREELLKEHALNGRTILDMKVNDKGETTKSIVKRKDN